MLDETGLPLYYHFIFLRRNKDEVEPLRLLCIWEYRGEYQFAGSIVPEQTKSYAQK